MPRVAKSPPGVTSFRPRSRAALDTPQRHPYEPHRHAGQGPYPMDEQNRPETQDFGTALEEFEQQSGQSAGGAEPQIGDTVAGKVLSIGDDAALVDLGGKAEGVVPLDGLRDESGQVT